MLYLRKVWLYFHASEIPRDADIYAVRADSRVLRALVGPRPFWFPDGLLMPLALIGIAKSVRERARLFVPLSFVVTQALSVALFFVSERYRVPAVPILALFAVVGFVAVIKSRALIGATLALAVLCALPTREVKMVFAAEREFFRGLSYRGQHDTPRAIEAERDPADFRPWFELGASLDSIGRPSEAADAWLQAGALQPQNPRPLRMAAAARLRAGDRQGAIRVLETIIRAGVPSRAIDHFELASIYATAGESEAALTHLRAAKDVDPGYFRATLPAFIKAHEAGARDPTFIPAATAL